MISDTYSLTISDLGVPAHHAVTHIVGGVDELSLSTAQLTSGTLPVVRGGTGAATLTGYVKGTGTTAMTAAASVPVGDISGTLSVGNGGTGVTTSTGSGANVLSTDAVLVTPTLGTPKTGSILTNCTGLPLTLGAGVTGILPIAYGGTGTVGTSIDTLSFDKLKFKTASQSADALNTGELRWNSTDNTLDLKLAGDVTLQVGQESNIFVYNDSGSIIPNGTVVYISGASGNIPAVRVATNANSTAKKTLGVSTQSIGIGLTGYITTQGLVRTLNTGAFSSGTPLYLGIDGALTSTEPTYPATSVRIGIVVSQNTSTGSLYVQPQLFSDGRTSGQFVWTTATGTSTNVSVSGLTASSHVIIQEKGAVPAKFFYAVVCNTGYFNVYALQNTGGAVPSSTAEFSYIAFV